VGFDFPGSGVIVERILYLHRYVWSTPRHGHSRPSGGDRLPGCCLRQIVTAEIVSVVWVPSHPYPSNATADRCPVEGHPGVLIQHGLIRRKQKKNSGQIRANSQTQFFGAPMKNLRSLLVTAIGVSCWLLSSHPARGQSAQCWTGSYTSSDSLDSVGFKFRANLPTGMQYRSYASVYSQPLLCSLPRIELRLSRAAPRAVLTRHSNIFVLLCTTHLIID